MDEEILKRYVGQTVSILLHIPKIEGGDKKETYNGILSEVTKGVLFLNTNNPKFHIKEIVCKCELVISLWVLNKPLLLEHPTE